MKLSFKIPELSIDVSTLLFVAYLITAAMVYYGIGDSMGTIQLVISLVTIGIFFAHKKIIKTVPLLILTLFALVLLLFSGQISVRGFNAPIKHALKFVHMLYSFTAFIFIRYIAKESERRLYVISILFVTALSCFRSISLVISSGNVYAIRYAFKYGYETEVAGFNQIYAIPFYVVIVLFLLIYRENKKNIQTIFLFGVLAVYLYFIARTLLATALIMTMIGILFVYFFKALRDDKSVFLISVLFLGIIMFLVISLFPNHVMNLLIDWTENLNYVLKDRLLYVAGRILNVSSGRSYSYNRREELASYSLETFKNHPLLGVGYSEYGYGIIGCHQEWYDMLGVFGIIGSIIVFAIIIGLFVEVYRDMNSRAEKDLFFIISAMFFLLGFLNPCLFDPLLIAIFAVVPNLKFLISHVARDERWTIY
ncbi:O-antigen ligase family protein [Oribacterium sp. NK2B42]|uniref:O-antigen ligase family protein n=1 Tax=Oribacterium sp. NK2B42 TaxID=689781 RepID=UPI00042262DF|nr:hypothetical protein [Oribacterium sp. NK2B42]